MWKRLVAIMMTLCLVMSMAPVIAEEEQQEDENGAALNPYTWEFIGQTIALPSDIQVTGETSNDDGGTLTLTQDGRQDVSYTISMTYAEPYAEYTMVDLPDEMRQEMIDYYASTYQNTSAPFFMDNSEAVAAESDMQFFMPFMAAGVGADNNYYVVYVCIYGGFVLTVSCGTATYTAEEGIDVDIAGTVYNLYWQSVDMFAALISELQAQE